MALPVWCGQVLLLLELLLQAHELQLREDGAAPPRLLLSWGGLFSLRFTATQCLTWGLSIRSLGGHMVGQGWADPSASRDQVRDDCGLSGDY